MLEHLLQTFGYPILFLGTILEGETVLVIAGFLAHRGLMDFWVVALVAMCGAVTGDQMCFHIGRRAGPRLAERRPSVRGASERIGRLLARHGTLLVLGFRFLYGVRAVTPMVVGASGYPPVRFLVLNMIGAAVWAPAVAGIGWLFGASAEALLERVEHIEGWLVLGIAVVGASAALLLHLRRRSRSRAEVLAVGRDAQAGGRERP